MTTKGKPCSKSLACPSHKAHCAEKIRQRAFVASQVQVEQQELPLLTWGEGMIRLRAAYLAEKALRSGSCGCQG